MRMYREKDAKGSPKNHELEQNIAWKLPFISHARFPYKWSLIQSSDKLSDDTVKQKSSTSFAFVRYPFIVF